MRVSYERAMRMTVELRLSKQRFVTVLCAALLPLRVVVGESLQHAYSGSVARALPPWRTRMICSVTRPLSAQTRSMRPGVSFLMQKGYLLHDLRIWDFHSQCRDSLMIALLTLKAMCSMLRSGGASSAAAAVFCPLEGLENK